MGRLRNLRQGFVDMLMAMGSFGLVQRDSRLRGLYEREQRHVRHPILTKADLEAIASDWRAVGDDLRVAIDQEKSTVFGLARDYLDGKIDYDEYVKRRAATAKS
jgi:hypothetical protein